MLRRWLSGLIVVVLTAQSASAAGLSCAELFTRTQSTPTTQNTSLYRSNFNYNSFSELRTSYENSIRSGQEIDFTQKQEKDNLNQKERKR